MIETQLGWLSRDALIASSRNRLIMRASADSSSFRILTATVRPSAIWSARYTAPLPPIPMHAVSLNLSPRTRPTSFSDLLTWSWTWLTPATWEGLLGAPTSRDRSASTLSRPGARPNSSVQRNAQGRAVGDSSCHFKVLPASPRECERLLICAPPPDAPAPAILQKLARRIARCLGSSMILHDR